MSNVYAGYRGIANIAAVGQVRFASASIAAKQSVEIPDVIMGDWDHDAYNYGKIEVGGSIAGPVTETFIAGSAGGGLWDWGAKRTGTCGELSSDTIDLYYYCGGSETRHRQFTGMYVNSLGFSCAAGDVAQFTIDVLGNFAEPWDNTDPPLFQNAEKFMTWDKVGVTIGADETFTPPANIAYSNFSFNIANNLTPVYSLGQTNLFPYEIVPGLRTVTGSLSVYNTPNAAGALDWDAYTSAPAGTIGFNIGALSITFKVRFHRVEPASSVGTVISTIAFTGIGHQDSLDA